MSTCLQPNNLNGYFGYWTDHYRLHPEQRKASQATTTRPTPNIEYQSYPENPEIPTCNLQSPSRNVEEKVGFCGSDTTVATLPAAWPRSQTIRGPANVKSLYQNVPNYYPMIYLERPVGTMYDYDVGLINPNRSSRHGMASYGFRAYPFQNLNVQEYRHYSDARLPVPDIRKWQHTPVVSEGTTEYLWNRD